MVTQITAAEAAAALEEGVRLIDVRQRWEWDIVHVEGSVLLDQPGVDALAALPRDTPLMFLCHHGVRSLHASTYFAGLGFTDVRNVSGGVDAWARDHDPSLARY